MNAPIKPEIRDEAEIMLDDEADAATALLLALAAHNARIDRSKNHKATFPRKDR